MSCRLRRQPFKIVTPLSSTEKPCKVPMQLPLSQLAISSLYFWERCFFAPHNINHHIEHHLFPGVPFYNLPKLSAALMRDETYRANAHITRGYSTGVLRECLAAAKRDKPRQLVQT